MGITTALVTEEGMKLEVVEDPHDVLHHILPDPDNVTYRCLRYIDWYGDTVFNHRQASQFLAEWDALLVETTDAETRRVVEGIRRLAQRLEDERHVYLKFIGD